MCIYIYIERESSVCKYGLWVVIWLTFTNDLIFQIVKVYMFVIWKDIWNFRGLSTFINTGITTVNLFSFSFRYDAETYHNLFCNTKIMRFEILMTVNIKSAVFWYVMPCSLVDRYWCFRGTWCIFLRIKETGNRFLPAYQNTQCHILWTVWLQNFCGMTCVTVLYYETWLSTMHFEMLVSCADWEILLIQCNSISQRMSSCG
jgi:hypothetical protein